MKKTNTILIALVSLISISAFADIIRPSYNPIFIRGEKAELLWNKIIDLTHQTPTEGSYATSISGKADINCMRQHNSSEVICQIHPRFERRPINIEEAQGTAEAKPRRSWRWWR